MNKFLYAVIIIFLFIPPLSSEERVSAGLTAGYHYDAGNFSSQSGFDGTVQQNISAGAVVKIDFNYIFLRSGAEISYPFVKGDFGNNVGKTTVSFVEAPLYAGINFFIRNYGSFYMGGGGSYIFGFGDITTSSGKVNINEQLFGYGMIAGLDLEIHSSTSFLLEWGYTVSKSSPVTPSNQLDPYDDYSVDFSGHRIRAGFLYHFNRY
jgi:hypothetical protein